MAKKAVRKEAGLVVQYRDDEDTRRVIFQMTLDWFFKHRAFCGDSVMQMDEPQLDAPVLLADVAERLGFEVEDKP